MKDKAFGYRVSKLRNETGLTQEETAQRLGIVYGTYRSHEAGQTPSRTTLRKYINYYGCDEAWLLTGKGEAYPNGEKQPTGKGLYRMGGGRLTPPPIQDRDGLFGRTKQVDVGGQKFAVTTHDPDQPSAEAVAISALIEILGSGDPVLVPAIQANLRAFQAAARKEAQLSEQKEQIQLLKTECDEFRKKNEALELRIEALERRMGDHHSVNETSRDLDAPGERAAV
jgi:transcriptional regulator with XRE-family HTH domain